MAPGSVPASAASAIERAFVGLERRAAQELHADRIWQLMRAGQGEDALQRALPYFGPDSSLGIVQTRWSHLNRNFNLLTRSIAIGIDVHFLVEQTGRFADGCYQNFSGSGGVLWRNAVLEAGGWQTDTLAEDLDLSYRTQRKG